MLLTNDGSFTFFSQEFGEAFHSLEGARAEAFSKFIGATDLAQRAVAGHVRLLDICYGLGYNTAAALETIWGVNPDCQVDLYGLELDETVPKAAIVPPLINPWSPSVQEILTEIACKHEYVSSLLKARLLIGDARQTLQVLNQLGFWADAIFFDPFSPRRCPQLWTVEFFQGVVGCLCPNGRLVTYSRAASVRTAMREAGLAIGTIPLPQPSCISHEWSQGTVGAFNTQILHPLLPMEQEHLQTRAAIPYRDPTLSDPASVIMQRRQKEQTFSSLESTSSWRKRWGIH